jgi:hypothetical protein
VADKYEVKKVPGGPDMGKWGVYKNDVLQIAFNKKSSATREMRHKKGRG